MIITEHTAHQTFKKNSGVYAAKRRDMTSAKLGQGMHMALRLYTCWMNKKGFIGEEGNEPGLLNKLLRRL